MFFYLHDYQTKKASNFLDFSNLWSLRIAGVWKLAKFTESSCDGVFFQSWIFIQKALRSVLFLNMGDHLAALNTACKLNVRETFRRRSRCHLNVICTFNLLLVFKKLGCFQIYANYYKLFKIIFLKRCKWSNFRKLSDFAFFHLFTFDFTQLADELNELLGSKWELRNAEQTLELIRLMVKIETLHERQELLKILQTTSDSSALKAFVRYKGLALLWSWMVDAPEEKMKYKREVWCFLFVGSVNNQKQPPEVFCKKRCC